MCRYRAKGQGAQWQMIMGPFMLLLLTGLSFGNRWFVTDEGYFGYYDRRYWGFLKHESGYTQGGEMWHIYRKKMCQRHLRLHLFFNICSTPICQHYRLKCYGFMQVNF